MIWIIITIILIIAFLIIEHCNYGLDGDVVLSSFLIFILGLVLSLIFSLISGLCVSTPENAEYELYESNEIIALKDNQNTSGSFYLLGGYVDEELHYYYAKETDLGYTTEKIKAKNCYIKYTNEQPRIEKYTYKFKNDLYNLFAIPIYDDRIVIYCPENTITTDFAIDLE